MIEEKHTAVKLIPDADWFIASGYYKSQLGEIGQMNTSQYYNFLYRELVNTFASAMLNLSRQYDPQSEFFLKAIREMVHHVRFGIDYSGYFFIYTLEGINVAYRSDPSIEGIDMIDQQDANGVYIIGDVISILETEDECYYDYMWENPSTGETEPKRSYIKKIEELNMYVGSGIYLD